MADASSHLERSKDLPIPFYDLQRNFYVFSKRALYGGNVTLGVQLSLKLARRSGSYGNARPVRSTCFGPRCWADSAICNKNIGHSFGIFQSILCTVSHLTAGYSLKMNNNVQFLRVASAAEVWSQSSRQGQIASTQTGPRTIQTTVIPFAKCNKSLLKRTVHRGAPEGYKIYFGIQRG